MTQDCRVYQEKTPQEKINLLKEKRACWSCLKVNHRSIDCMFKKQCTQDGCVKYHHESLHQAHVQGIAFHSIFTSTNPRKSDKCLLQLMQVTTGTEKPSKLTVLWDGGATISLITFTKARSMGLVGEPVQLSVVKVGGERNELSSYIYDLSHQRFGRK